MLRIHFTAEDLGRTRMAGGPLPMWETVLSLHRLQRGDGGPLLKQWRRSVCPGLPRAWKPLAALVPPQGYFPDFLTPPQAAPDEALDRILHTPRAELVRDMSALAQERTPSPWLRDLGEGRTPALTALGTAVTAYHRTAIAPYWDAILAQARHSRTRAAEAALGEGTTGMLTSLPLPAHWRGRVLEISYPVEQDLHLEGRGLLLVPSFFCLRTGVTLLHNEDTPVLVYPVEHHVPDDVPQRSPDDRRQALAALLGHARAAVLEALQDGGTTTELARRAGVLPSSASQHTSVLRNAGLVRSVRRGRAVVHSLTPLGATLLRCGSLPPLLTRH
ncbi:MULTISPECIES: ArsR/SmtB family transcription factor [Streptomyces]|uniref:ArsR/SmtB family transcription factor n=1 Tax=Streptomyces TaxID=1883 RepID=UPI001908E21B|nr:MULTISPECIES: winged helix-turn-helix domain-containing protein [unclassified Streptomyces]MCU4748354.1 winged helix-turn-helix domain-containing protein [Streptomyces sp. G-5]QQN78911.1 winged helix-turn-helix transcriptional regulator [Streptomyces sp. XC 2026]